MEQGLVFDIKRYAIHDGPGIRTTVHLKGCPLSCWWCHNPESQSMLLELLYKPDRCIGCGACVSVCEQGAVIVTAEGYPTDPLKCRGSGACADICPADARELCGRQMQVSDLMRVILKDRIFYDQSHGGVTFSGGEPLMQPAFVMEALRACCHEEIHTAIDTCGFVAESALLETVPFTKLYLYDLKLTDPIQHKKYTGVDNELILSNLTKLGEAGASINARIPFIPGINSSDEEMKRMGEYLSTVKGLTQVNLLPYHAVAAGKHRRWGIEYKLEETLPPTEHNLRKAAAILERHSLKVHIGG